ncbi:MAG: hypothetical protein KAT48_00070, partial [Bacteroidales bacterium]|nr:hypothetical protein [Bacteroidales bacterium]
MVSSAYTDDGNVNYVEGFITINGNPATLGTNYTVEVISGSNIGYIYSTGYVDDFNVFFMLYGNGKYRTSVDVNFSSGDGFRVSVPGYSQTVTDIFIGGGNSNVNLTLLSNFIRGRITVDGFPAPDRTNYTVGVITGPNAGFVYNGAVNDSNVNPSFFGNGYYDTGSQPNFTTGDTFEVTVEGYAQKAISTFIDGGNLNTNISCINVTPLDDTNVNYITGVITINGSVAPSNTQYVVTVTSGSNNNYTYNGRVDDANIPLFMIGNGMYNTTNQLGFTTGDTFSLSVPGYTQTMTGTFITGGNTDVNLSVSPSSAPTEFIPP